MPSPYHNLVVPEGAPVENPRFTGAVHLPAGTAASPGLCFTGDVDSGFYSISADCVGLATAGVERMRVAADGSVRVGTQSGAVRAATISGNGTVNLRYDDNGAPEILTFQNYSLTGAGQGLSLAWSLGVAGSHGAQAVRMNVRSSDSWTNAGTRNASWSVAVVKAGSPVERLSIDADGTTSIGGPKGAEGLRVTVPTNTASFVQIDAAAAGAAVKVSAQGTAANVDLALAPKGSGRVSFGTFTAGSGSIAGYIEILDSTGTPRRLAVLA